MTPARVREVVLVGGGHSHAVALREFALRPLTGARLTLICTDPATPYSGMLPGYVAGHYRFADVHIDLPHLAAAVGARFVHDEAIGIDRAGRRIICRHGAPLPYDLASINIGSTPRLAGIAGEVVPVKPIRRFNERWLALLERVRRHAGDTTIAVVGAGAAGVELALAMHYRLRNELAALGRGADALHMHLYSASARILPSHNAAVRAAFERELAARGIAVHGDAEVVRVDTGCLHSRDGGRLAADEIVWVTQAGGAAWLRNTGLALDDGNFIRVRDTLQSESDDRIFAAGDCAAVIGHPLEKAGVFAVRMGLPLAGNLRRALAGQPLQPYRPQRRWLALISTGDRRAVASRGIFHARGGWVWHWKDWIDRRFMRRFAELPLP